jgi:hypothetical protein
MAAFICQRYLKSGWMISCLVSFVSILFLGLLILFCAIDGALCILMAFPLALIQAILGAIIGHYCSVYFSEKTRNFLPLLGIALFPLLVAWEHSDETSLPVHKVATKLSIHAPLNTVWQHVISFSPITEDPNWLFQLGIAYPIQAKIDGQGVGAIRYCMFSTGPFVEPITKWDAPRSLEFGVSSNPAPMKELSFWPDLDTPHLHRTFTSNKGQFHLWEENGGTVLEGTTWYTDHVLPDWYWHWISDYIVHQIHLRVLEHIKHESESSMS